MRGTAKLHCQGCISSNRLARRGKHPKGDAQIGPHSLSIEALDHVLRPLNLRGEPSFSLIALGIMRAPQRLPDLQMTISALQRSDWSAV